MPHCTDVSAVDKKNKLVINTKTAGTKEVTEPLKKFLPIETSL